MILLSEVSETKMVLDSDAVFLSLVFIYFLVFHGYIVYIVYLTETEFKRKG